MKGHSRIPRRQCIIYVVPDVKRPRRIALSQILYQPLRIRFDLPTSSIVTTIRKYFSSPATPQCVP